MNEKLKQEIEDIREHITEALQILNRIGNSESLEFAKEDFDKLETWMKDRIELWSRVLNEGGVLPYDELRRIWVDVMGKSPQGLGGNFSGKMRPAFAWLDADRTKVALTSHAHEKAQEWTGRKLEEISKIFKKKK